MKDTYEFYSREVVSRRNNIDPRALERDLKDCISLVSKVKRNQVPAGLTSVSQGKRKLCLLVGRFVGMATILQARLWEGGWGRMLLEIMNDIEIGKFEDAQQKLQWSLIKLKPILRRFELEVNELIKKHSTIEGITTRLKSMGLKVETNEDGKHLLINNGSEMVDYWPEENIFQLRYHKADAIPKGGSGSSRGSFVDLLVYLDGLNY